MQAKPWKETRTVPSSYYVYVAVKIALYLPKAATAEINRKPGSPSKNPPPPPPLEPLREAVHRKRRGGGLFLYISTCALLEMCRLFGGGPLRQTAVACERMPVEWSRLGKRAWGTSGGRRRSRRLWRGRGRSGGNLPHAYEALPMASGRIVRVVHTGEGGSLLMREGPLRSTSAKKANLVTAAI